MAYKNIAQNRNELSNLISLIYISNSCECDVKKKMKKESGARAVCCLSTLRSRLRPIDKHVCETRVDVGEHGVRVRVRGDRGETRDV